MKNLTTTAWLLMLLAACQSNTEKRPNNSTEIMAEQAVETKAIEELLFSYRDALNSSDVSKVLSLYTGDGVFMPSSAPSAIGQAQLKAAYEFVFSQIQLNIEFYVDEVVVNGEYAFARTISKGTTLIHANKQTVAEENRELFVLQKVNGQWKIARYMFNKMK